MPYDDWNDDEDWDDDADDVDDYESAPCPECGRMIYSAVDKCPACGYWLTDADRRTVWSSASPAPWIKLTAALVLLVLLIPLVLMALGMF